MKMSQSNYQRIWHVVQLIPSGRVASYGQVADLAGLPGRARLTGKALGHAPSELNLPWFRVLRASGQLAFPPGSDSAKRQTGLLQQDGIVVLNNRVKLSEFQWQPGLDDLLLSLPY